MAVNSKEIKLKKDSRSRINLGQLSSKEVTSFRAKRQKDGTIILRPIIDVEFHPEEAWLFKNKKALAMVKEGLKDSASGRVSEIEESFWDEVDALPDEKNQEKNV